MKDILDQVEFLFKQYSFERRAMTQPYLLESIQQQFPTYEYSPHDAVVRETLMEHVGSLPVLAVALYPHINDPEVNLGEALTMLAIHDIGELLTGDENTFTKNGDGKQAEFEAGLKLLHPSYHVLYTEVENKTTKTAQFAKAIDKITPDIFDYVTPPEIARKRFKILLGKEPQEIVPLIVKHKRPYMEWNPFMTEFHGYLMQQLQKSFCRNTHRNNMTTTNEFSFILKPASHGVGVFAVHDIPKDTHLRLFGDKQSIHLRSVERPKNAVPKLFHDFCMSRGDTLICPEDFGQMHIGWYLNHSNNANAFRDGDFKWYAKHDIKAGEEITIDYNSLDEPAEAKQDYYHAQQTYANTEICPICKRAYSNRNPKVQYHLEYGPAGTYVFACRSCNYAEYLSRHWKRYLTPWQWHKIRLVKRYAAEYQRAKRTTA